MLETRLRIVGEEKFLMGIQKNINKVSKDCIHVKRIVPSQQFQKTLARFPRLFKDLLITHPVRQIEYSAKIYFHISSNGFLSLSSRLVENFADYI